MHVDKNHSRKKTSTSPSFCGRVWIDGPEGTFLGYGRIILLERICEYGSITKAARSMVMSYRHAWELVDSMNRQAIRPFVEAVTGGRGGGGARLTKDGEAAIHLFWTFYADLQNFLKHEEIKLICTLQPQKRTTKKNR
jgi:molybdate transport system regulatory protein